MRYSVLMAVIVFCPVIFSCKKSRTDISITPCVTSRLNDFIANSYDNGASVKQYRFQTKVVYAFSPGTCGADLSTGIIDADCNSLGSLGGFSGNTKINGEEFSNAVFIRTIWQR